ncbi:hypothetical protein [Mesorhizobium sp.]|nr:hypothetical protein [Mesorhizobium sp.]
MSRGLPLKQKQVTALAVALVLFLTACVHQADMPRDTAVGIVYLDKALRQ